jgi:hypothetical protein
MSGIGQEVTFRWEVIDFLPGTASAWHLYYPGASKGGGGDGVMVRVEPEAGSPWFGTFAFGKFGPKVSTGGAASP